MISPSRACVRPRPSSAARICQPAWLCQFERTPASKRSRSARMSASPAGSAVQQLLLPAWCRPCPRARVVVRAGPGVRKGRLRHMLIAYARVSKTDGSESLDLQRDALRAAGIDDAANLYHDLASGVRDDRSQAQGRRARRLEARPAGPESRPPGVGLAGARRARARRSTPRPRPPAPCSASSRRLAEFEEELIRELTVAGLKAGPGLEAARAAGSSRCRKP